VNMFACQAGQSVVFQTIRYSLINQEFRDVNSLDTARTIQAQTSATDGVCEPAAAVCAGVHKPASWHDGRAARPKPGSRRFASIEVGVQVRSSAFTAACARRLTRTDGQQPEAVVSPSAKRAKRRAGFCST
jgi:hypothetical protein